MKPYYVDEAVCLYHGDCREILPQLTEPVDLVLTDPPYGEVNRADSGLRNLDKGLADEETVGSGKMAALLLECVPSGSLYVWAGTEQVSEIRRAFVEAGLSTRLCIWEKTNPSPMNGQYLWLSSLEACVFGKRKSAAFNEFCQSPVWRGPTAEPLDHPTPKPLWLMKRLILASSSAGQTVLDPFAGSGTTLRAAKDLGRKAIGCEIEERYCEIAAKRMSQSVMKLELPL